MSGWWHWGIRNALYLMGWWNGDEGDEMDMLFWKANIRSTVTIEP